MRALCGTHCAASSSARFRSIVGPDGPPQTAHTIKVLATALSHNPPLYPPSAMREIVHLQAGQCGNQIGAKFWEVRIRRRGKGLRRQCARCLNTSRAVYCRWGRGLGTYNIFNTVEICIFRINPNFPPPPIGEPHPIAAFLGGWAGPTGGLLGEVSQPSGVPSGTRQGGGHRGCAASVPFLNSNVLCVGVGEKDGFDRAVSLTLCPSGASVGRPRRVSPSALLGRGNSGWVP